MVKDDFIALPLSYLTLARAGFEPATDEFDVVFKAFTRRGRRYGNKMDEIGLSTGTIITLYSHRHLPYRRKIIRRFSIFYEEVEVRFG